MVVGYARVSTVGQSLDVQLEQLKQAGCEKIFKEKGSGANKNRPELTAMVEFVRDGDEVVTCKLDRIARSTRHLLEVVEILEEKSVGLRVLNIQLDTATPTGRLMLTMLAGIAAFEREMMLERQAEGIAKAKKAGRYKGRKATARAKAGQVIALATQGVKKREIARGLDIGIASVYRILSDSEEVPNGQ